MIEPSLLLHGDVDERVPRAGRPTDLAEVAALGDFEHVSASGQAGKRRLLEAVADAVVESRAGAAIGALVDTAPVQREVRIRAGRALRGDAQSAAGRKVDAQ